MTIVKVQRPIVGDAGWLVYAQGRDRVQILSGDKIDQKWRSAMGDDLKSFFKGSWGPGDWVLGDRVADEDW